MQSSAGAQGLWLHLLLGTESFPDGSESHRVPAAEPGLCWRRQGGTGALALDPRPAEGLIPSPGTESPRGCWGDAPCPECHLSPHTACRAPAFCSPQPCCSQGGLKAALMDIYDPHHSLLLPVLSHYGSVCPGCGRGGVWGCTVWLPGAISKPLTPHQGFREAPLCWGALSPEISQQNYP